MSINWGTIRIILGTLGGGALGFYVMHNVENNYKEKIRADIVKLQQEEGQLGNTKSKELLDAEAYQAHESKMLLRFQDPVKLKTKRVAYEETYYARDSGTLEQLKELSTKRQSLEESINGSSRITPAIAREMAGGITSPILQDLQKLERYLPLLENLVSCVEEKKDNPKIMQWTTDLAIRWTSPLSGSSGRGLTGPKYFRVDDLRYELGMTFFLYGSLLRELALEVLSKDLVEAGTLFRKASGIYQHLAENVLPPLKPSLPPDRCPEATASLASIMSIICLAEAQAVTVRRAEEKASSGGLLAKLHYGVVQFLEDASLLLRTSTSDWNDISDKLRKFIAICGVLHESRSQRYIAAEYTKVENFGVAVGVLRYSLSRVQPLRPSDDVWKVPFRQEQDILQNMLRKCENENEFIWREKAPPVDELPALEGKKLCSQLPTNPLVWIGNLCLSHSVPTVFPDFLKKCVVFLIVATVCGCLLVGWCKI